MPYRVALVFYICMSAAVIGLFALQGHTLHQQCVDSSTNREAIRDSLKRGFVNLGYLWDEKAQEAVYVSEPTLDYWREHLDEVPGQVERLRQELDGFPTIECGTQVWPLSRF